MTIAFGIYPGGVTGTADGTLLAEVPDQPEEIRKAVRALRGSPPIAFRIRGYIGFQDEWQAESDRPTVPSDLPQYAEEGCTLDVVAQYQTERGDVEGYLRFIRTLIDRYGSVMTTLQIGEEANVTNNSCLDGAYPNVQEALVRGVSEAKEYTLTAGFPHINVGINSTVLFGPATMFYRQLLSLGGQRFARALDYIGLDAFPGVFQPFGGDFSEAFPWLIHHHREQVLAPAGLDHLPIHITEHGWPTGKGRLESRQQEVLEAVVEAIATRPDLKVTAYTHFSLRDAGTDGSLFAGFGLMNTNYKPKPAFYTYRDLIERYGDAALSV